MPAGVSSRFKRGQRPIAEAREKQARIVDPHRLDLAGEIVFPLGDERLIFEPQMDRRTRQFDSAERDFMRPQIVNAYSHIETIGVKERRFEPAPQRERLPVGRHRRLLSHQCTEPRARRVDANPAWKSRPASRSWLGNQSAPLL